MRAIRQHRAGLLKSCVGCKRLIIDIPSIASPVLLCVFAHRLTSNYLPCLSALHLSSSAPSLTTRPAHVDARTCICAHHIRTRSRSCIDDTSHDFVATTPPLILLHNGHQHGRCWRKARTPYDCALRPTLNPYPRRLDRELDGLQAAVRGRRPEAV